MPTIKDVARMAGTSVASVSRHLNGENVRPENARRIDAAVKQLQYYPNHAAKMLKTSRSQMVGLVVSSLDSVFYSRIAGNAQLRFYQADYSMLAMSCQHDANRVRALLRFLIQKGAEGIIAACSLSPQDHEELRALHAAGVPVVVVDDMIEGCDCIMGNGNIGAYEATSHLLQNAHTRVAYIGGDDSYIIARERHHGFLRALEGWGVTLDPRYDLPGNFTEQHGRQAALQLLGLNDPPTALLAGNHDIALGVLETVYRLGLRVPDDLSLVLYDDIIPVQILPVGMTTVDQKIADMGFMAAELILKRLNGEAAGEDARCYSLAPELHIRGSVKNISL